MFSNPNLSESNPNEEKKIGIDISDLFKSKPYLQHYKIYLEKFLQHLENVKLRNEKYSQIILPSAEKNMFEILEQLLEEYCLKFIDHDLEKYRKDKKIDIYEINSKEAENALSQYLEEKHDIKELYPAFDLLFSKLTENYTHQISLFIDRIVHNIENINKGFNPQFSSLLISNIKLTNIISTGSDLHHQGAQVLVMKWQDETNGQTFKVIYKPSSVEADAFITGNMKKLKMLDESYNNSKSFVEILNEKLKEQNNIQLPTYLIMPREDKSENLTIFNKYGFMEFINHSPWETIDCTPRLVELIRQLPPAERAGELIGKLQEYYDNLLSNSIKEAALTPYCDYILQDHKHQLDYSFASGCLVTIIFALGIIDMHVENMIVSNKLPVLIDLENCFYIDSHPDLNKTLIFQQAMGSFSHKSVASKQYSQVLDITGLQNPAIEVVEKNRSYTVYQIIDNKPIPYLINEDEAIRGIDVTLNLFSELKDEFKNWFNDVQARNICILYIPLRTSELKGDLDQFFQQVLLKPNISTDDKFKEEKNKFKDILLRFGTERNIAIYKPNSIDRYLDELLSGNIPVYYTFIKSQILYDFSSKPFDEGTSDTPIEHHSLVGARSEPRDFFPISPYDHIFNRFQDMIINKETYRTNLATELGKLLQKLSSQNLSILQQPSSQPIETEEKTTCCSPKCNIM